MPARGCEMIPIEVLCEIFHLLCTRPIYLQILENKTRFDNFPWAVGQVSRRWREALLSYPALWTSLGLNYNCWDNSEGVIDRFAEMNRRTVLYLERSRQLPLNIYLSFQSSPNRRNYLIPSSTLKSLLSSSNRWKKLHLSCLRNTPSVIDDLFHRRGEFSSLQSLSLESLDITAFEFRRLESAFAVLPRLKDLKITNGYSRNTPWVFPWSQLKKLTITVNNTDCRRNRDLEVALSQLQNVEELWLFFYWSTDLSVFALPAPIQLSSVRFLRVPLANYPYIFKAFKMPALEHLWASNFDGDPRLQDRQLWNMEIRSFISRSSCHIRRLTIEHDNNGLPLTLMETLPSIEYLCIQDTRQDTAPMLIRHITSSNDRICLPNLQELHVICCIGQGGKQLTAAIMGLLEARSIHESRPGLAGHKVAPLKNVTVEWQGWCRCGKSCTHMDNKSRRQIVGEMVETMRSWSSIADVSVENSQTYVKSYLKKRQRPIVVGADIDAIVAHTGFI